MKEITVEVRHVYGEEKYYPVCEVSKMFAKIADTKTLTKATLKKIVAIGYEIKFEQAQPEILGEMK